MMFRAINLVLATAFAGGCATSDCERLDDYYDTCCSECGGEEPLYCNFDAGSNEELCEGLVTIFESFGTSLEEAPCACGYFDTGLPF